MQSQGYTLYRNQAIYRLKYVRYIHLYIYIYKQWEIIHKETAKEMYKAPWIHGVEDHSLWENKVLGQFR